MAIRRPGLSIINRKVKLFGVERKMELPEGYEQLRDKFGPYVQIRAKWQSLWDMISRK